MEPLSFSMHSSRLQDRGDGLCPHRPKAGRGMMRCFGGRPDRGGDRRPRACPPPARGRPGFAPGRQSRPFQAPAPKAAGNRRVRQAAPSWSRAACMPRRSTLAKACGRFAPPQAGCWSETYAHRAREPAEASGRGKASGQGEGSGPGGRHRARGKASGQGEGSGPREAAGTGPNGVKRPARIGPPCPALACLGPPRLDGATHPSRQQQPRHRDGVRNGRQEGNPGPGPNPVGPSAAVPPEPKRGIALADRDPSGRGRHSGHALTGGSQTPKVQLICAHAVSRRDTTLRFR